jgi:hypothetical protein
MADVMSRIDHLLHCPTCSVFGIRRRARVRRDADEALLIAFHTNLADKCYREGRDRRKTTADSIIRSGNYSYDTGLPENTLNFLHNLQRAGWEVFEDEHR